MEFVKVRNNQNEIILDTPNRDEILHAGPPKHSQCSILGRGSYGIVFKAVFGGKQVAVKIIKNSINEKNDAIFNEANILGCRHRNIVQLLKIESTVHYGIVIMERFPGQCLQRILDSVELPLQHRIHVASDMINALVYCHKRGILHLDVKPQNVLVAFLSSESLGSKNKHSCERRYICKICDFGSSALMEDSDKENTRKRVQGTLRYMAPEVFREDILTPAADVFSLGISMWQLKSRMLPYSWIESNEVVAYQVVKTHLRPTSLPVHLNNTIKRDVANSLHGNCICEHYSSDISHRTLDHIRTILHKTKTLSPFRPKPSINQMRPEKLNSKTSRNLLGTFQSTFGGLKENLLPEKLCCNLLEDQFKNDFSIKGIFADTVVSVEVEAEQRYEELFKICWHSEPLERPQTFELKNKLKSFYGEN